MGHSLCGWAGAGVGDGASSMSCRNFLKVSSMVPFLLWDSRTVTLGVRLRGTPPELAYTGCGARRARQFLDSDKRATGAVFRQLDSYD